MFEKFIEKIARNAFIDKVNEDFATCQHTQALGLKDNMAKRILKKRDWWGGIKDVDIYFLPQHAPKWDIKDVTLQDKVRYFKVEPKKYVEVKVK